MAFLPEKGSDRFKPTIYLIADLSALGITAAFNSDELTRQASNTLANLTVEHNFGAEHITLKSWHESREEQLERIKEDITTIEEKLSQTEDFDGRDKLLLEWEKLTGRLQHYADLVDRDSSFQAYLEESLRKPRTIEELGQQLSHSLLKAEESWSDFKEEYPTFSGALGVLGTGTVHALEGALILGACGGPQGLTPACYATVGMIATLHSPLATMAFESVSYSVAQGLEAAGMTPFDAQTIAPLGTVLALSTANPNMMRQLTFTSKRALQAVTHAYEQGGFSQRLQSFRRRVEIPSAERPWSEIFVAQRRKQLFKSGKNYEASYIEKQSKGLAAEVRGMQTLERAGYKGLDCRLPREHGLDGVFVKYGQNNEVQDIIIMESKYANKGRARLPKDSEGFKQMSDGWINKKLELMEAGKNPALVETAKIIDDHKHLVRRKVNIVDGTGKNRWNSLKPPKTDQYKE